MTKFQIAITTLVIGYMLGQSTDFIKYKWAIWRKKKALDSEIDDIRKALDSEIDDIREGFAERASRIEDIAKEMQKSNIGVVTPSRLFYPVYDSHYAEIAPFFSKEERKAINAIYNHVENFNSEQRKKVDTLTSGRHQLFALYSQCKLGYVTISTFQKDRAIDRLINSGLREVNSEIRKFAELYLKTSK